MTKTTQTSLIVLVSLALTALVITVVFPAHARGGVEDVAAASGIRHAVLVENAGPPSENSSAISACPYLSRAESATACPYLNGIASPNGQAPRADRENDAAAPTGCPYLDAKAAEAGCPSMSTDAVKTACPYLSGKDHSSACPRERDDEAAPREVSL